MKYKLIDVRSETEKNVRFGTCEMCFRVQDVLKEIFVFEDENGKRVEVEGGELDIDTYRRYTYMIENVIDFADFVRSIDIEDIEEDFLDVVWQYEDFLETRDINESH